MRELSRLELADYVAKSPCLPHVEHFRHHMQLNSGVLMLTKAGILIAFNGVDILNVPFHGDGGTHGVSHTGHCNNQQNVKPQFVEAQPRAALGRILVDEHSQQFVQMLIPDEGFGTADLKAARLLLDALTDVVRP